MKTKRIPEGYHTLTPYITVKDQYHGDRSGALTDPFGHKWTIMTHIEDVSFDELQKRTDAMFSKNYSAKS